MMLFIPEIPPTLLMTETLSYSPLLIFTFPHSPELEKHYELYKAAN